MTKIVMSPQMRQMILKAKQGNGSVTCDPRAYYPVGHKCAATTNPVAGGVPVKKPDARITRTLPLTTGGAVVTVETKDGETVEATTDANGAVKKVEVKNKFLIPAAIAAAFFFLGG